MHQGMLPGHGITCVRGVLYTKPASRVVKPDQCLCHHPRSPIWVAPQGACRAGVSPCGGAVKGSRCVGGEPKHMGGLTSPLLTCALACSRWLTCPPLPPVLAGGLPIGAVLMKQKVADVMAPGDHGSTFAGNPLVCHTACSVYDIISDPGAAGAAAGHVCVCVCVEGQ